MNLAYEVSGANDDADRQGGAAQRHQQNNNKKRTY